MKRDWLAIAAGVAVGLVAAWLIIRVFEAVGI